MFKIAICDDDERMIDFIRDLISHYLTSHNETFLLHAYRQGASLVRAKLFYDLMFLDIEMPGLDGLQTAQRVREYDTQVQIVYITNYPNFQNVAFQVHAFGYITKPFGSDTLNPLLDDFICYARNQTVNRRPKVMITTADGPLNINTHDILYFECQGHLVTAFTVYGAYALRTNLKETYDLVRPHAFLMPHKSYIVNLYFVKKVKGYEVQLINGEALPVAQKKMTEFRAAHNSYLQGTYNEV